MSTPEVVLVGDVHRQWHHLHAGLARLARPPNLADYAATRAGFSWSAAAALEGLPGEGRPGPAGVATKHTRHGHAGFRDLAEDGALFDTARGNGGTTSSDSTGFDCPTRSDSGPHVIDQD